MKNIHITASVLMVLVFLGNARGFVEKRHQWWEVRLQNLTAEKAQLRKNTALDGQVIGIIENETNRARDIIAVFESEMRDDGSLTDETRVMTEGEIASETRNIVPPLFALHQFEALVSEPGTGAAAASVREAVKRRLQSLIYSSFGEKSPDLAGRIMDMYISRDEWKILAMEYSIGRMMAARKEMENHTVADITGRVSLALNANNNRANARELRNLTVRLTGEYLGECGAHGAPHDSAALEASWTWKRIEAILARDFNGCKKIIALMKDPGRLPGAVSLERIMFYHRNPAELESLLFKGQRPRQPETGSPAHSANRRQAGAVMLDVPAPLRADRIMDDMDKLRRGAISAITGREDERYFDGLGKGLAAAINRHAAAVKNRFFREEERVRLLRKKDGEVLQITNEQEFLNAKKEFHAALALVGDYRKKSMGCTVLVSEGRKIASGLIVEQYRYRLRRDEEYLRFAAALVAACSRLSNIEDPRVHKEFSVSMSRINSLFTFVGAGLALEKNDQTQLAKRDRGLIRDIKTRFVGTTSSLRSDISCSYGQYAMKRSKAAGSAARSRESLKETIAQDEIDGLFRHAVECVELYEQYQYGGKSLYRYAEQFKVFMKEARTGLPSEALAYSLKANSLLSSLDKFDGARVAREAATKKYLQKEAKTSLAGLISLLEFYKKNRVLFKDAPKPGEIAALEKRFSTAPQVRIDAWIMNESNYQDVDKKAAKKLSLILARQELVSDRNITGDGTTRVGQRAMISLKDPEMSLTLPRGWEEDTVGETETYMGIVKSFHSGDGSSSVRLVRLAQDNGEMKDTAEEWIQKSGCSLVEKRWQKAGDVDCFWILARDKNKNIFETCSISKDGYVLLITGKTSRNHYLKFKAQFKKIIDSLQMETL